MKAVVAAFNQEKALVGAFAVITNLRMNLFGALAWTTGTGHTHPKGWEVSPSAEQSQKTRFQLKSSARTSRHFRIPLALALALAATSPQLPNHNQQISRTTELDKLDN